MWIKLNMYWNNDCKIIIVQSEIEQFLNSNDGIMYRTYKLYSQFINSITKPSYQYSFKKISTKNHNLPVVRSKWFNLSFIMNVCVVKF